MASAIPKMMPWLSDPVCGRLSPASSAWFVATAAAETAFSVGPGWSLAGLVAVGWWTAGVGTATIGETGFFTGAGCGSGCGVGASSPFGSSSGFGSLLPPGLVVPASSMSTVGGTTMIGSLGCGSVGCSVGLVGLVGLVGCGVSVGSGITMKLGGSTGWMSHL